MFWQQLESNYKNNHDNHILILHIGPPSKNVMYYFNSALYEEFIFGSLCYLVGSKKSKNDLGDPKLY